MKSIYQTCIPRQAVLDGTADFVVKLVDRADIGANDWSLTPGRYVGVAPEEEDGGFDFAETLREIHVELGALNKDAQALAETIGRNFQELGV
jgi:type I restriction enzyme M protein